MMINKCLVIFMILFSFVGCTTISKSSSSRQAFVTGPLPADYNVDEMESNLARRVIVVPGDDSDNEITITAVLQTAPLVEAKERESVRSGDITVPEAKANITSTIQQIVTERTCFLMDIRSSRGGSRSNLTFWRGRLEQPVGKFQTVSFKQLRGVATDRDAVGEYDGLSGDRSDLKTAYSLACAPRAVDLSRPVRLHMSAKWDLSNTWYTLEWL